VKQYETIVMKKGFEKYKNRLL